MPKPSGHEGHDLLSHVIKYLSIEIVKKRLLVAPQILCV
jgi:hypothetical protein